VDVPVRVFYYFLETLSGFSDVPESYGTVIAARRKDVLLVRVKVNVSNMKLMGRRETPGAGHTPDVHSSDRSTASETQLVTVEVRVPLRQINISFIRGKFVE
jgi:hypothetical protein